MSRGAFLKARLGVNGSQNVSRSFGAVAVTAAVLAGDMGTSMTGGGYKVRRDLARIGRSRLARPGARPIGGRDVDARGRCPCRLARRHPAQEIVDRALQRGGVRRDSGGSI